VGAPVRDRVAAAEGEQRLLESHRPAGGDPGQRLLDEPARRGRVPQRPLHRRRLGQDPGGEEVGGRQGPGAREDAAGLGEVAVRLGRQHAGREQRLGAARRRRHPAAQRRARGVGAPRGHEDGGLESQSAAVARVERQAPLHARQRRAGLAGPPQGPRAGEERAAVVRRGAERPLRRLRRSPRVAGEARLG
jgi:hypothetical protein